MSKIDIWENAEPGVVRKIVGVGKQLMMMEVHFEKGAKGNEHFHVHEQLTYCIEGEMEFTINGVKSTIQSGESITIPSNELHSVVALEKSKILDVFHPIREDLLHK